MSKKITAELSGGPHDGVVVRVGVNVEEIQMDGGAGEACVYTWANRSHPVRGLWMFTHTGWVATPRHGLEIIK